MNDTPKIEKGIPLPARGKHSDVTAMLLKMEVGDSIFFPGKNSASIRSNYITNRITLSHMKFVTRAENDGCRLWVLEKGEQE